jgi:hypothetical protein
MLQPGDLSVLRLEMDPEPVWQGQSVSFQAVASNNVSGHPGSVSLFIKESGYCRP